VDSGYWILGVRTRQYPIPNIQSLLDLGGLSSPIITNPTGDIDPTTDPPPVDFRYHPKRPSV